MQAAAQRPRQDLLAQAPRQVSRQQLHSPSRRREAFPARVAREQGRDGRVGEGRGHQGRPARGASARSAGSCRCKYQPTQRWSVLRSTLARRAASLTETPSATKRTAWRWRKRRVSCACTRALVRRLRSYLVNPAALGLPSPLIYGDSGSKIRVLQNLWLPTCIVRTKPLSDFLILLARPVEMVGNPSNAPDRLSGFLFPDGVLQTCLVSEP